MKKKVVMAFVLALALLVSPLGTAGMSALTASSDNSSSDNSSSEADEDADDDEGTVVATSSGVSVESSVPSTNQTATAVAVSTPESTMYAVAPVQSGHYISMTVEGGAGEEARQILSNAANAANATIASVIDISLNDTEQNGVVSGKITQLNAPIEFVVAAPDGVDAEVYDFAMIRLHDGVPTILPDLDNDPATITFATDQFSAYAVVYGAKGSFDKYKGSNTASKGTKDSVPKTGDNFPAAIPAAAILSLGFGVTALRKRKEA